MNPYWVIGFVILALGVGGAYAWRRHLKNPTEQTWFGIAMLCWLLETKARAARAMQRMRDRKRGVQ